MTYLISGKEALIALANGEEVEFDAGIGTWHLAHKGLTLHCFDSYKFRLKPRTITINGIEVPTPFEPKISESAWVVDSATPLGYRNIFHTGCVHFMCWRTEDEIKQVVAALRQVFGNM